MTDRGSSAATIELLEAYAEAWNAHDVDRIMAMMTPACVFEAGGGTEPIGTRFVGQAAVRARFEEVWRDIPDASWHDVEHFGSDTRAAARRGCSAARAPTARRSRFAAATCSRSTAG